MLVIGKAVRVAAVLAAMAVATTGCSDDDPAPDGSLISATEMRGAMLQVTEIGSTWAPPDPLPDPNTLVSVCGGTSTPPPAPPGAEVVSAPLVEEGEGGAQTLHQTALVYGDKTGADAAFAGLRAVAEGCAANVSVPQTVNDQRSEPAYTEAVSLKDLNQNGWTGFAVVRHKEYEPTHPGTADTSVAILAKSNVVLIDAYAVYRLAAKGGPSTSAQFTGDWERLVGTVVNRAG